MSHTTSSDTTGVDELKSLLEAIHRRIGQLEKLLQADTKKKAVSKVDHPKTTPGISLLVSADDGRKLQLMKWNKLKTLLRDGDHNAFQTVCGFDVGGPVHDTEIPRNVESGSETTDSLRRNRLLSLYTLTTDDAQRLLNVADDLGEALGLSSQTRVHGLLEPKFFFAIQNVPRNHSKPIWQQQIRLCDAIAEQNNIRLSSAAFRRNRLVLALPGYKDAQRVASNGTLFLDGHLYHTTKWAQDHEPFLCYHCWGRNHTAKRCKRGKTCGYCGAKGCDADKCDKKAADQRAKADARERGDLVSSVITHKECVNCREYLDQNPDVKRWPINHAAWDRQCPCPDSQSMYKDLQQKAATKDSLPSYCQSAAKYLASSNGGAKQRGGSGRSLRSNRPKTAGSGRSKKVIPRRSSTADDLDDSDPMEGVETTPQTSPSSQSVSPRSTDSSLLSSTCSSRTSSMSTIPTRGGSQSPDSHSRPTSSRASLGGYQRPTRSALAKTKDQTPSSNKDFWKAYDIPGKRQKLSKASSYLTRAPKPTHVSHGGSSEIDASLITGRS